VSVQVPAACLNACTAPARSAADPLAGAAHRVEVSGRLGRGGGKFVAVGAERRTACLFPKAEGDLSPLSLEGFRDKTATSV
jgi:hypothetical protein